MLIELLLAACPLAITPGAVFPTATADVVCVPGYASRMRNVSKARKRHICRLYGAKDCPGPKWEIDHYVPLCIGGSNDDANLWAQPIGEAKVKDVDEDQLCHAVCERGDGKVPLVVAQAQIRRCGAWSTP